MICEIKTSILSVFLCISALFLLPTYAFSFEDCSAEKAIIRGLETQLRVLDVQWTGCMGLNEHFEQKLSSCNREVTELEKRVDDLKDERERIKGQIETIRLRSSEFLGIVREALGDRKGIAIVGDHFVIQPEVLFDTGSVEVDTVGREVLNNLANALKEIDNAISNRIDWYLRVEGHADTRPVKSVSQSNWHLSTERAIAVVNLLVEIGVPPKRLAAVGFAEYRPRDDGKSEAAHRRNRRIEFTLNQYD